MTSVAVVGGSEESRLLLRGLVRLHRHRVVAEGGTPEVLRELPADGGALVVLIDADLDDEAWSEGISSALRGMDHRRGVLITPSRSPAVEQRARALGIVGVLRRPFAIHELVEVLTVPGEAAPGPGGPGPSAPP